MSSASPSQRLEAQHRRIDRGIEGVLDRTAALSDLADSLTLLRLHVYIEEAILFPPLEENGLSMPVYVMKYEHGEMWPLIEALSQACASQKSVDMVRGRCRRLFQILQVHNPKEEEVVYAAADRLTDEQGDGALVRAIEAAELPEGWFCATARS